MKILSVPLRFTNDGGFLKIDSTSDEYKAQQVRAMVSTHQGERKLFPSFGITDPTFDDFVPEVTFRYQPSDTLTYFLAYKEGWKSGGRTLRVSLQ